MGVIKKVARLKRSVKARKRIALSGRTRLTIFRSPKHIYAQLFSADGSKVLASASSVEKEIRGKDFESKIAVATAVGKLIAKRVIENGVSEVAFDRSGFKFHGRVKALADAAKEEGLKF